MPDIVDLILTEHARIGRLFEALDSVGRDDAAGGRLDAVWADLAGLLDTYAAATREICFLTLVSCAAKEEFTADLEDITQTVAESRLQPTGSSLWWLAVRAARAAVTDHIGKMESGPLPVLGKRLPQERREALGCQWHEFVADRTGNGPSG